VRIQVAVGSVLDVRADAVVRVTVAALGRHPDSVLAAAGPDVRDALRAIRRTAFPHGLAPGEAVTTGAGRLAAMWCIHVNAPAYRMGSDKAHELARAYRSVLAAADEVLATTVAMPALGSSVTYWPLEDAARIAVTTLRGTPTRVGTLTLLLPSAAGLETYAEALVRG
jgi:O-acetyl-ADP-ribose deacetylase